MSMGIGEEALPDKERRRWAIEDALLAFRPEDVDRYGPSIRRDLPDRDQALENLRVADVPRLLKHRILVDGFVRSPVIARSADLREPVGGILRDTIPPRNQKSVPNPRLHDLTRQLDEVTAAGGECLMQTDWHKWVTATTDVYHFTTAEKTFQACNDRDEVDKCKPGGDPVKSRLIVAEFWSELPPSAYADYINPINWPMLSVFWEEMKPLGAMQSCKGPDAGYDCDFQETVKIVGEELTVPLEVGVRTRTDGSRLWVRFNIARPRHTSAVPVDVDTGTVSAEAVPGGPAPTRVRATKYLHWADGHTDFTDLACDFGWAELMVEMASNPTGGADVSTSKASATGATSVDEAVKRFVADVSKDWKDGIDAYTPQLEKLIGRFTGPTWNIRWVNDLLAMGNVAVDKSGNVASHLRRLADSLKAVDAKKDENG